VSGGQTRRLSSDLVAGCMPNEMGEAQAVQLDRADLAGIFFRPPGSSF
jgi:hypothetical protein